MRKWLGIGSLIFLLLFFTGCGLWQTERSLTGVVADQDIGVPLEGVSVNLDNFFTTTDSSGAYTFKNLPKGDYTVRAVKSGYHNKELEVAITGEELLNFALEATKKGSVSGVVTDEQDGTIIEGAEVSLGTKATESDDEGEFLLEGLPVGDWTLIIKVNGYSPQTKTVLVEEDKETELEVKMVSTEAGGIKGILTDQKTGHPVQEAIIKVGEDSVETAGDGSFQITGLPSGEWDIFAEKAGYAETGDEIIVEPGTITTKDLTISPNVVTGKVVDEFGQYGLAGATVTIPGIAQANTASNGTFQLHPVPLGEHLIQIEKANYGSLEGAFELQEHTMNLGEIELRSTKMGAITGLVHIEGDPAPWVKLYAYSDGVLKGVGQSNQDGIYTIYDLAKGPYEIALQKDGYKAAEDFESQLVMISPGEKRTYNIEIEPVIIDYPLSGYVTDTRGGPPLVGADVEIDGLASVVTDSTGFFSFDSIPASPFDVYVSKEGIGGAKVQDVYVDYSLHVEIPTRKVFNPDWSTVPPTISISGVEAYDEVAGDLVIDIAVMGDDFLFPFVFYVYFGGMQRFPVEGQTFIGVSGAQVTINTEKHPDGPSFIRVLAYDENENTTQKIIPVTVINDQIAASLPGELPYMTAFSLTMGKTFGFYSDQRDKLFQERDLTGSPNILELPEGQEINLDNMDPGATHYARVEWVHAPGADGYAIYRGDKHLGNINGTRYDDYSLSHEYFGSEVVYTVIPYNDYGFGKAKSRVVPVLKPFNVNLDYPGNEDTEVELSPTFAWSLTQSFDPWVELYYELHLFDATYWKIWETEILDIQEIKYPDVLEPGVVYSWDIIYADAFLLWELDGTGFSFGVSVAGDMDGSLEGENIFTTTTEVK